MNHPFYPTGYIYSRLSVSIHFKSMLRFIAPRCTKNLIFPNRFLSISRQTLLNSPRFLSQPSFSRPIVPGVLCSYRNRSVTRRTNSPTIVASGLRSDRAMATQSSNPQSVYDFTVKDARGNDVELSKFKGKVLLIVNVASQCGFTNSNYPELTQLYQKYKDQGFEVLAFPSNQFGGQEPGTNEEIENFVCTRFKAEYPIFDKVDVNGSNASPLYKFLKSSKGGLLGDGIKWNFTKFLVDKEGNVIDRYAPTTTPLSIEKDIKKALGV